MQGAAILGAAGILSKILGALYRIPFARMVGGEGMGMYQMAYPIYTLALALSTSGLPTALAVMTAERVACGDHQAAKKIFRVALVILTIFGAVASFGIYSAAPFLAIQVFHHPPAFLAIRAVAPAVFLSAVVSCWRGYFQGYQNMVPTAVSQIVEQIVRVATVLVLTFLLLPLGIPYAAAGAAFGAVTGGMAAIMVLILFGMHIRIHASPNKVANMPTKTILKRLFTLGVPVSLAGLIMPFVQSIDAIIIPGRLLVAGYSSSEATELYGQLTGMSMTLINLPAMLTVALATVVIPVISEAYALKDKEKIKNTIQTAIMTLFLWAIPASIGLYILAEPVCRLLYKLPQVGVILQACIPIIIAIGFYQVTSGIIQGMGKMLVTLVNLSIGCLLKVIITYYFVGNVNISISGAAYATAIGFFIAGLLNAVNLIKWFGFQILDIPFIRIIFANILIAGLCEILWRFFKNSGDLIGISIVILVVCIAYFAITIFFGILSKNHFLKITTFFRRN